MQLTNSNARDSRNGGFTLLELLIVLSIISVVFSLGTIGIMKVRQVILVTNTAKELRNNLKKARRYALDSVVTSNETTSTAYYVEIDSTNDMYYWGECDSVKCTRKDRLKSTQYEGVEVSGCASGGSGYQFIKFVAVTGEFVVSDSTSGASLVSDECIVTIKGDGTMIRTSMDVHINVAERTFIIK